MKKSFEVKFINTKNNFLYFNDSASKEFNTFPKGPSSLLILQLVAEDVDRGVFTVSPVPHKLADWEVGISLVLAKALKLKEGVYATLSPITTAVPVASSVSVSPASDGDFDVLELNSNYIQFNLLHQLQVLATHQPLVVWPTPQLHLTLIPDGTVPASDIVLLNNTTELHVSPNVYQATPKLATSQAKEPQVSAVWSGMQKILQTFMGSAPSEAKPSSENMHNVDNSTAIFRVHSLREEHGNPSVVHIHPQNALECDIANVELVWPASTDTKQFLVQIKTNDSLIPFEPITKFPIVYVSDSLMQKFSLKVGIKILLTPYLGPEESASITFKLPENTNICKEDLNGYLQELAKNDNDKLLMNSGTRFKISSNTYGVVILDKEFAVFDAQKLQGISLNISDEKYNDAVGCIDTKFDSCKVINGWKQLYEDISLSVCSNLDCSLNSVIVIDGPVGCGKNGLMSLIESQLTIPPSCVNWSSVDCRTLKGKQVENVRNFFLKYFQECVRLQPSVAYIKNVEVFCAPPSAEQRESAEASYCLSVQALIWDMAVACCDLHNVAVVATTSNNEAFRWPNEVFPVEYFTMPELSLEDKSDILYRLLNGLQVSCDKELVNKVVKMTEGYRIQDVNDLADRVVFSMWKRSAAASNAAGVVQKEDVVSALAEFVPQGMRGIKLFSARAAHAELAEDEEQDSAKWANVGGLDQVKKNLTELIEWPSKYPELFKDAPLKLQTGIVLYGMPGSGKTLIAAELARFSGANFISVKGPELLSKYIGASEQAVRDLFEKANSAKPAILFFDEFDSLAPSRGRDTTGVSDRVVNQLLTSLDGVDSPTDGGVWVVAATSRPDLLDNALLRPGRLDTLLYCPLPNEEERLEILKIQSRKLTMADDVDLHEVAENTAGFSGADLQAVLYTAQLAALEDTLDEVEERVSEEVTILVTRQHVARALQDSRASLSPTERARYDRIYKEFEQMRIPGEAHKITPPQQRTALA